MVNLKLSPGDPIFYLHHAWLDRLWWLWQTQHPETRLTEVGGVNIPASTLPPFLSGPNATFIPPIDPACFTKAGASSTTQEATDHLSAASHGNQFAEMALG